MAYYLKPGTLIQVLSSYHHRRGVQCDHIGLVTFGAANTFVQQSVACAMAASFGGNRHEPYHWPLRSKKVRLRLMRADIPYGAYYFPIQFSHDYFGVTGVFGKSSKSRG